MCVCFSSFDWPRAEARKELLEKIQAAVQLSAEVTLEIDKPVFGPKLDDITRIGDTVKSFLEGLRDRCDRDFAKDDVARAALQGEGERCVGVAVCIHFPFKRRGPRLS